MVDSFASALKINLWLQTNGGGVWAGGHAPSPERKKETITRYGLSELMLPSCRLFTQYACAFVFIRLAAQQNETLAQLYINKHMAPRKRKMGTIGSKRVVVRWLEECWRNVFLMAPSKL